MALYGTAKYGRGRYGHTPSQAAVLRVAFNPGRLRGYDIFVKRGSLSVVGTDLPALRVGAGVGQVTLSEAGLELQPNATYYASIVGFNRSGHAASGSAFTFMTDAETHPLQAPTPIINLRVTPLAGGQAVVSWRYQELNELAVTDNFVIWLYPLAGQAPAPESRPPVNHTPPRAEYRQEVSFAYEGPWRIEVWAVKNAFEGDKKVIAVTGVEVMIDGSPPAAGVVGLTAT